MNTKSESGSATHAPGGSNGSNGRTTTPRPPNEPLDRLGDLLADEAEWFDEESRVSIEIKMPEAAPQGPRSIAPVRAAKSIASVLGLLPPWGRVIVLVVGIMAAVAAYRWEWVERLTGL